MPQNFFIIGSPKVGKTTLLKKLVNELGKESGRKIGGFISPEERHYGTRTGFSVMDIESGKTNVLASIEGDGPRVGKYHVDVKSFESIALPAMDRNYEIMIIDEIGIMELKSQKFSDKLDELIDSRASIVATLHRDLVDRYGLYGEIFELTQENRERVYFQIKERLGEVKKVAAKKEEKTKKSKKVKDDDEDRGSTQKDKRAFLDHVRELIGV